MDVSLDAGRCAAEMKLRVAIVAVVRLGSEPAVNVVAIANQKSARVGSVLLNPVSVGVLREEPRALDANLTSLFPSQTAQLIAAKMQPELRMRCLPHKPASQRV